MSMLHGVSVKSIIATYWHLALAARQWHSYVSRQAGRTALLFLLIVSIAEPLACLAHCQLLAMAIVADAPVAADRHHHIAHMSMLHTRAATDAQAASHDTLGLASIFFDPCLHMFGTGMPEQPGDEVLPAVAHEHAAVVLIVVIVLLALRMCSIVAFPTRSAPLIHYPPPLRPPTWLAA